MTLVAAAVRVLNVLWWRPTTSRPGYLGYSLTGDSSTTTGRRTCSPTGNLFVDPFLWMNRGVERWRVPAHPPLYRSISRCGRALGIDTVTGAPPGIVACSACAAVVVIGLLGYRLAGPRGRA